ncbi:MAG: glycosyltransferase [Pseudomonadota bacterium]
MPDIPFKTGIPKTIFQIFLQGGEFPEGVEENIQNIKSLNPDWDYEIYDLARAEEFIKDHYGPDILAYFRRIDPSYQAVRADLLRYLLCYALGGVYLDLKSTVTRPLCEIVLPEDEFILTQWAALKDVWPRPGQHTEVWHIKGGEFCNWTVISAKGHPFLKAVIAACLENIDAYRPFKDGVGRKAVFRLTGPVAYTLAIDAIRDSHPNRMAILEEDGFVFSIYGDVFRHRKVMGAHYANQYKPVIVRPLLEDAFTRAYFGSIYPLSKRVKDALIKALRVLTGSK